MYTCPPTPSTVILEGTRKTLPVTEKARKVAALGNTVASGAGGHGRSGSGGESHRLGKDRHTKQPSFGKEEVLLRKCLYTSFLVSPSRALAPLLRALWPGRDTGPTSAWAGGHR